jgi:hypothetical protein
VKITAPLFKIEDTVIPRPARQVAHPVVSATEDDLTGIAGVAIWGELLDRLSLVAESDRRQLRPIGPGGYSGGECYRAVVETQLAGGDFISDRSLLDGEATARLRGEHALPSGTTLWRFLAGADLGRVKRAEAVNRTMLRRAWAMGAGPAPGVLTIDPDATYVSTYGPKKEGSRFSYKGEVQMSPLVGVCGETGDVLALRARAGNASPRKKLASFVDECVAGVPEPWRSTRQLWVRVDSAGYSAAVVKTAIRHGAAFTITCLKDKKVQAAIYELASDEKTVWVPAIGAKAELAGSEVAECAYRFAGKVLRMIVRRQRTRAGEQLSFDDLDGWRFHAIITNIAYLFGDAASIEHHHRLRGGAPEEAIRQLKEDFGLNHAPLENFSGNWLWWCASALAYNAARWVRVLALPESFATCRGKRLRLKFLNVPARVTTSGRQLRLRLPRAYAHAKDFAVALARVRALPAFA